MGIVIPYYGISDSLQDYMLSLMGFNDQVMDSLHLEVCKSMDFKDRMNGIKHYNDLKGRINKGQGATVNQTFNMSSFHGDK